MTILVFDMVNTPLDDQNYAKKELLKYLTDAGSGGQSTSLLAITRRGIKVISDFTSDPKALAMALRNMPQERQLVEEASRNRSQKQLQEWRQFFKRQREKEQQLESHERVDAVTITMVAMQQIAQYCAGLPGRKALLWATAGFPFSISEMKEVIKIVGPRSSSLEDVNELYRKTWKALNQAQVAVYPIDVHGRPIQLLWTWASPTPTPTSYRTTCGRAARSTVHFRNSPTRPVDAPSTTQTT